MKHNYKPLTTFRGWSSYYIKWVYGSYINHGNLNYIFITHEDGGDEFIEVHHSSIGIYTGKDDANGTPIFCGVDGALYGGDIIQHYAFEDGNYFIPEYTNGCFEGYGTFSEWRECKVISTQYEQHLKEKQ